MCVGARLRLAERRLQRLQEVQAKRELLRGELAETQGRLMLEPGRWLEQCEFPQPRPAPQSGHLTLGPGVVGGPGGWKGERRLLGPAGTPGLTGSPLLPPLQSRWTRGWSLSRPSTLWPWSVPRPPWSSA